jgi:hypothetical protein
MLGVRGDIIVSFESENGGNGRRPALMAGLYGILFGSVALVAVASIDLEHAEGKKRFDHSKNLRITN